ncbi:MAG TPA: UDP-N-acetylmuramoyl-L-alanine--D-glutamate ligase [Burkholderiaceae bacterium]
MNYAGKHALVLGLGESGLAMAQWLAHCGASVRVADTREAPARLQALRDAVPEAQFSAGPFAASLLEGMDFVAVSPGLAPGRELAEIDPAAQAANVPVWGEIELFAQALLALREQNGYVPKVLAITGTNGKTTVTRMTGLLCERAGLSVAVAGNISPSALDVLREKVAADALPQCWVLELSSFQLETTFSLNPDAAAVLNLTQDHLDWHGDMDAYARAKARIFGADTVRVLNRDDALVMKMADPQHTVVTFSVRPVEHAHCFGLQSERDVYWLSTAVPEDDDGEKKPRRGKNAPPLPPAPIVVQRLMPSDALQIRGQHNAANALAALALCRAIGLPLAPLLHGLREYKGEPHRVEFVANINGVDYVDDSKGTNVGATVAALTGLGTAQSGTGRLVLIAGGDGKGQDFAPLADPIARHVRAVVLIGRDAQLIEAALDSTGVTMEHCISLPEAVERAAALAGSGDTVLLSPACASLDMFDNYAHRAQVFVDAVRERALAEGQIA